MRYFPIIEELLRNDPGKQEHYEVLMRGNLSEATQKIYNVEIRQYRKFCNEKGLILEELREMDILMYIAHLLDKKVSVQKLSKVLPALQAVDSVLNSDSLKITERVKSAFGAAKRERAKFRLPTKKAQLFEYKDLEKAYTKHILPHIENGVMKSSVNVKFARAILRGVIIYHTYCRFSDFRHIKDSHCKLSDNSVEIVFPRSKNDQLFKGSHCVITKRDNNVICPVQFVKLFFKTFGLSDENPTGKFLNFRYEKCKTGFRVLAGKGLCLSNATRDMREMLNSIGLNGSRYTEKSFKVSGVTASTAAGMTLDEITFHGRWRCSETPRQYRTMSIEYRKGIAQKIPC